MACTYPVGAGGSGGYLTSIRCCILKTMACFTDLLLRPDYGFVGAVGDLMLFIKYMLQLVCSWRISAPYAFDIGFADDLHLESIMQVLSLIDMPELRNWVTGILT